VSSGGVFDQLERSMVNLGDGRTDRDGTGHGTGQDGTPAFQIHPEASGQLRSRWLWPCHVEDIMGDAPLSWCLLQYATNRQEFDPLTTCTPTATRSERFVLACLFTVGFDTNYVTLANSGTADARAAAMALYTQCSVHDGWGRAACLSGGIYLISVIAYNQYGLSGADLARFCDALTFAASSSAGSRTSNVTASRDPTILQVLDMCQANVDVHIHKPQDALTVAMPTWACF